MILWILLAVLVVAISFVLAIKSMRDFTEVPAESSDYGLFLIRQTDGLTVSFLDSIRQALLKHHYIISFERLFKGGKSALVVFGPRQLLLDYQDVLNLLELEDYTNVETGQISAWEVGIKKVGPVFKNLPQLADPEQFWWQLIFSHPFKAQITAVVVAEDGQRRQDLSQKWQNLTPETAHKMPKAYSNKQLLEFYKLRSIRGETKNPILSSEEILQFLLL